MELKYVGRGRVTKIEMKARLIKLKNDLYASYNRRIQHMMEEDEYFDENLGLVYMDTDYDDLEQTDRE